MPQPPADPAPPAAGAAVPAGRAAVPAGRLARVRAVLRLVPNPRRTPFTFWYLIVLLLTDLLMDFGKPSAVHRLLNLSSTDAVNLRHHPLQVLFLSALWLDDGHWLVYAVIFAIVIAPLERRLGATLTILIFASGHVLATLATELPVLWAVRSHVLPRADGHLLDIGVSYGVFAVAGAVALILPKTPRWWAIGALNSIIVLIYFGMGPGSTEALVTTVGHLLSVYIGMLGWLPLLRRRGLIGSMRMPRWHRSAQPAPATPAIAAGTP